MVDGKGKLEVRVGCKTVNKHSLYCNVQGEAMEGSGWKGKCGVGEKKGMNRRGRAREWVDERWRELMGEGSGVLGEGDDNNRYTTIILTFPTTFLPPSTSTLSTLTTHWTLSSLLLFLLTYYYFFVFHTFCSSFRIRAYILSIPVYLLLTCCPFFSSHPALCSAWSPRIKCVCFMCPRLYLAWDVRGGKQEGRWCRGPREWDDAT